MKETDRQKSAFIATISHELRNPVAAISNSAHLLQRLPLPPTAQRPPGIMTCQLGHINALLGDLLDISRIERGSIELRRQRSDLREAVSDALDSCRDR